MARMDKLSTYCTTIDQAGDLTCITYHSTQIVAFDRHNVSLRTGGWDSVTTRRKMNQASTQFGLGYGVTGRLLDLRPDATARLGESFEVRPTPGTSLESLRMRFGAPSETIDDLGLLEQEQRRRDDNRHQAVPAPSSSRSNSDVHATG